MIETKEQTMALVRLESDSAVMSFWNQANGLREYAEKLVIRTAEDLTPVTNDLSVISQLKKALEEKRKEYVVPLQGQVKDFNDAFKTLMEPIEIADKTTRAKILEFQVKQQVIRQEQERINQMRMDAARAEMELKGELTESVDLVEVVAEAPTRVSTDMGTIGQRDNWKWKVVNFTLVPDEYKMINPAVVTPAAKSYKDTRTIPGIEIYNEPIIAVNAR